MRTSAPLRLGVLLTLLTTLAACGPEPAPEDAGATGEDASAAPGRTPSPGIGEAAGGEPPEAPAGRIGLDDLEETLGQLAAEIQAYSMEERQQVLEAVRDELGEIDARIDRLARQADTRSQQVADDMTRHQAELLEELRTRRAQVSHWADRLSEGSADAWVEIQTGFARALLALGRAMEDAQQGFDPAQSGQAAPGAAPTPTPESDPEAPTDGTPR